jgi:D-glucosaminate-6-phosphate ammonia-lyase
MTTDQAREYALGVGLRRENADVYASLGIQPVINAAGTLTRLGGSLMLPEVVEAIASAAQHFVKIDELQQRAGEIIGELTGAESGYVVAGAAAGILLSTAASIAGADPKAIDQLPDTGGLPNEVIIQAGHRSDYDHAARSAGAVIVSIGYPGETMAWELRQAINERTAAVLYVANRPVGSLSLPQVAKIAHDQAVPIIVDAAAALPPLENLRRFVSEGADLVVFSGGKALRGPQASGIVAGRADLIRSIALQQLDMDVRESTWAKGPFAGPEGRPFHGIGRPLKVGKEEVVGALVALQAYGQRDHGLEAARIRSQVQQMFDSLSSIDGLTPIIEDDFGGRPRPALRVSVDACVVGMNAAALVIALEEGEPRVCVNDAPVENGQFVINPSELQDDQAEIVIQQIRAVIQGRSTA